MDKIWPEKVGLSKKRKKYIYNSFLKKKYTKKNIYQIICISEANNILSKSTRKIMYTENWFGMEKRQNGKLYPKNMVRD